MNPSTGCWISFELQQFNTLLAGLETRKGDLWIPATWTECLVKQNGRELNAVTTHGEVRYDALPGGGPIAILAATK